jgi:hypothetical protein
MTREQMKEVADKSWGIGQKAKFPLMLKVKETHANGDFFWKTLCMVYDNEALGLLERLLSPLELKTETYEPINPHSGGIPGMSND